jgi:hypothetical protein
MLLHTHTHTHTHTQFQQSFGQREKLRCSSYPVILLHNYYAFRAALLQSCFPYNTGAIVGYVSAGVRDDPSRGPRSSRSRRSNAHNRRRHRSAPTVNNNED